MADHGGPAAGRHGTLASVTSTPRPTGDDSEPDEDVHSDDAAGELEEGRALLRVTQMTRVAVKPADSQPDEDDKPPIPTDTEALRRTRCRCTLLCACAFIASLVFVVVSILLLVEIPSLELFRLNPAVEMRLAVTTLDAAMQACEHNPRQSGIIVSMSSLPLRVPYLSRTLKTMLLQTVCPRTIYVWLPPANERLGAAYEVPAWLADTLSKHAAMGAVASPPRPPRVVLHRVARDWGPATKLLPALMHEPLALAPTQRILVCDDDVLYSSEAVSQYECASSLLPDAALTFHGKLFLPGSNPDEPREFKPGRFSGAHAVDLMLGTATFLVQPRFFPAGAESIANYSLLAPFAGNDATARERLRSAAYHEDDWYWSFLLLHSGVPRVAIPIDRTQLEQSDTLVFVGRGSLTSTANSRTQDPEGGGRSNAIAVARAFRQRAHAAGMQTTMPAPTRADELEKHCPLKPREPWDRCQDAWTTRILCTITYAILSRIL